MEPLCSRILWLILVGHQCRLSFAYGGAWIDTTLARYELICDYRMCELLVRGVAFEAEQLPLSQSANQEELSSERADDSK